jgi:uncharacterized protein (TIGR02217 family)
MAFFECEFPRTISYKRMGGPTRSTTVNQGLSAQEQRNKNWIDSRGEWEIALKTPKPFDAQRQQFFDFLVAFFEVVSGQGDGFRLFDHLANTATNQLLVTYNGNVQLALARTIGARTYTKIITKPITSAISDFQGNALPNTVFLHGTTTPVSVDPTTGIVTGQSAGTPVDFQYHIPVRFGVDKLPIVIEESNVKGGRPLISMNSVPILEVLPPNY